MVESWLISCRSSHQSWWRSTSKWLPHRDSVAPVTLLLLWWWLEQQTWFSMHKSTIDPILAWTNRLDRPIGTCWNHKVQRKRVSQLKVFWCSLRNKWEFREYSPFLVTSYVVYGRCSKPRGKQNNKTEQISSQNKFVWIFFFCWWCELIMIMMAVLPLSFLYDNLDDVCLPFPECVCVNTCVFLAST